MYASCSRHYNRGICVRNYLDISRLALSMKRLFLQFSPHSGYDSNSTSYWRAMQDGNASRLSLPHARGVMPSLHSHNISMLTPNACSIRNAISGDSEALPFSRAESVARRTPRISALLVTLKPSVSSNSVWMNLPGCDGVMPISIPSLAISDNPPDSGFLYSRLLL